MPEQTFMEMALEEAAGAAARGEVPVGCVIVSGAGGAEGRVLARTANRIEERSDPTAHAEMLAIRAALAGAGLPRLDGCDLYVTLEPCAMCAAAIAHARIRRLYFGAYDPKSGGVDHGARVFDHATCHHKPEIVGGVLEFQAAALLKAFFKKLR